MGHDISGRRYGGNVPTSGQARFPAHARQFDPVDPNPERFGTVKVYEPDGKAHWAWARSGIWRKLEPFKDPAGEIRWMERGTINNVVMISS
jgi:hypothetical protein